MSEEKTTRVKKSNPRRKVPLYKPLNTEEITKLARLGCTFGEIADFFNVHRDTIEHTYRDFVIQGKTELKISIRRAQIKAALEGDKTMLVWLGKVLLGQAEPKQEVEVTVSHLKKLTDEELDKAIQDRMAKLNIIEGEATDITDQQAIEQASEESDDE